MSQRAVRVVAIMAVVAMIATLAIGLIGSNQGTAPDGEEGADGSGDGSPTALAGHHVTLEVAAGGDADALAQDVTDTDPRVLRAQAETSEDRAARLIDEFGDLEGALTPESVPAAVHLTLRDAATATAVAEEWSGDSRVRAAVPLVPQQ